MFYIWMMAGMLCWNVNWVSREIDEGAKHLLEIKRLIKEMNSREKQMPLREPDLMIVLTGGEMAYKREDGVYVIPLGCLRD